MAMRTTRDGVESDLEDWGSKGDPPIESGERRHDLDHDAADVAAAVVVEHLDLRSAVHVGHSTGGIEAVRSVARPGTPQGRAAKRAPIGVVAPIMVDRAGNPGGLSIEVFDGCRRALAADRAQVCLDVAGGPFYGYNRPGAKTSHGVIQNRRRKGMTGAAKAHCEGIDATERWARSGRRTDGLAFDPA